ncbi:Trm112 family protein [bacterium]|nr:Trm112 family protein [bacterium]
MALSKDLLELLVCPKCKGELTLLEDNSGLVCPACRLSFPIKDDIPMMLVDEAETMG